MTLSLIPKPPTDAEFLAIFNRLVVAMQAPADNSGVAQDVYFEALQDLPNPAIEAGALALMREPGRRFFPTTAEWRAAAEAAQIAQLKEAVKAPRAEPWHFDCTGCGDTGWTAHDCDGSSLCGRVNTHAPHEYVTPCPCRPTNRTYQRRRAFGAGE